MINSSKKLKSISGYLPISLWASESHSSHENSTSIAIIGDKNGRIFCTKCFYDKFEMSPPTSLFHACEDLLLLLKYEKRNLAIKLLVDNMLEYENGVLLINEISITKDKSLTDGLIILLITILNKHFSLADNNSRLTVRETILCSIFRMHIIGTNAIISILKFLSTLINDKISVYANFMMEGIIEDNFRLQKLKELVNHLDKKTLQYTIVTLIRLLEYKPEFVIQDIINTCELSISKVFLELSDDPTQFKILLDFYLYIFANHKECFYSLIFHTSRECLFNILNGISNAMVNTKFIEVFNELTDNSYINFLPNNQNNETKDMLNTNSDKVLVSNKNLKNKEQFIFSLLYFFRILVIFYNENKEDSQNETCMSNIIDECKRSRWLLGTEFGNFLNKIIESIVEILKSSRNIDNKYSALKCILDIFTSSKCIEFFDSNLCYKQNQIMEIHDNISSLKDDPSNIPILKGKSTKRITFKRTRIDDTNQIIKHISNDTTQVKEEYCIHQFFYFKHGFYTIDILLEILSSEIQNKGVNDKLYANVNLFQISESSENKLRENGYTILNMTMECIYRILRVNVPTHSCPRYLYVLSWFISCLLKKDIGCQPPLPLFGLSSIELIMQTSGAEEPLENVLINIIDLFHSDRNNLNKSIPELVIPKNNENIIKLCNYMVRTVKVMSIRLSEMTNKSTVNDIDIWRYNSTIHNKIRLIEYFTYVIITISGITHYKGFNLVDFMYSSNLIFEFYSRQLSSKEQVILDVCQLLIAKSMLEMRKKSNLLDKDEIIQLDNLPYDEDIKINLEYTTNNDLFSLVLKLSNNLKSRLPNEKDQRISNICKSILKDTESLIYNEEGAKVVFRWLNRPSQINEKDMEMSRMSYKWISNIAKHLLEPLLTEREIQERLQFVTKSKIYASLTLNETVSSDTISIIISLLYFCYIFYPDQIKCFISKYLKESDVKNMNYNCFNFIQNDTFNLDGIDGRNIRMLPPRVVMYYSYILTEQSTKQVNFEQNNIIQVTDIHLCGNGTNNLTNITNNIEQEILGHLFLILVHSTIRRKEWLTWHSEKFGHCRNFCYSLMNLSLIAENCISDIQNYEVNIYYSFYNWVIQRSLEYYRYQIFTCRFNCHISPIIAYGISKCKIFFKYLIYSITNLKLSCDKKEANISDFCKTNFSIQDEQDIIDEKLVQTSLLLFGIRKSIEINAIKSIINLSELINPFLQLLLDKNSSRLHAVSPKIQIVIINTFLTLMEIICEALDLWLDKCNSNVVLLFSFIHQFTLWLSKIFDNNIMDVDISRYTTCITVILLKFSDIELRRSTEVNNSIIMFLENESLYLTFNKMMDFVIYHQENNSLNQDNHFGISLVVCLSTIFLLLNKYGEYFVSSKILKSTFKNLFLYAFAHPKLFLHKNDNKCNHDSSMCINCLNYGLNSLDIKVKMVTLLCIIVYFINKEQDVEMTWNIDESILYHIYMNCLLYILPNSHNDEYSLVEEATFAVLCSILYLSNDKSTSYSIMNNIYLQKYIIDYFLQKIMINLGSTMNLDYPFKYFNFMIYILYITNASPWWFDIHTIVNIPFVKKIGNLYNYIRSFCNEDNNLENNTHVKRYLAVLEAILKSILSIVHRSNNISEDEFLNKEDNDAKVYSCLIEDILMNQQSDIKLNDKSKLESIFKVIGNHSTDKTVENCLKLSFNVVLNNIVKY